MNFLTILDSKLNTLTEKYGLDITDKKLVSQRGIDSILKRTNDESFTVQEAVSFCLQNYVAMITDAISYDRISGDSNVTSQVFKCSYQDRPIMVMKYSRKLSNNIDTLREFTIAKRYLNPLRVLTPNFVFAYGIQRPQNPKGHYKAFYEYVNGVPLRSEVKKMQPKNLIGILLQVCFSLQIAQEACLFTHYDLHDDNIMLVKKPFKHVYKYGNGYCELECDYEVKIIDYGYSFVSGCGFCSKTSDVFGVKRLTHVEIYSDMFSTGFDICKLIGYLYKYITSHSLQRRFKELEWMWKKYIPKSFLESTKTAIKQRFALPYESEMNYLRPGSLINNLAENNRELCNLKNYDSDPIPEHAYVYPPEIYLWKIHPVKISDYYNYVRKNSSFNAIYKFITDKMYNWFAKFTPEYINSDNEKAICEKLNIQPLKFDYSLSKEADSDDYLIGYLNDLLLAAAKFQNKTGKTNSKEIEKIYSPCIKKLRARFMEIASHYKHNWRNLQQMRMLYRPVVMFTNDDDDDDSSEYGYSVSEAEYLKILTTSEKKDKKISS